MYVGTRRFSLHIFQIAPINLLAQPQSHPMAPAAAALHGLTESHERLR